VKADAGYAQPFQGTSHLGGARPARCVWGEERSEYTTRPEIRSASYGKPLIGSSILAQPGIDFDVR